MARVREEFVCRACGTSQAKWAGRCPSCNAWDSMHKRLTEPAAASDPRASTRRRWERAARAGARALEHAGELAPPPGGRADASDASDAPAARPIAQIDPGASDLGRMRTGLEEMDRVLGGGLVPGSATLIGGDPGIGKSTLLLQAAGALAAHGARVLYVSSEESAEQVRLRADRLGVSARADLFVLAETNLARVIDQAARVFSASDPRRAVLVADSIQMLHQPELPAWPGGVTQIRRCGAELVALAKAMGPALVLVGHVTKDGRLAGPRLLEHLVDTVLSFEGDRAHARRVLRSVKNRFGPTLEIGLFEMGPGGLRELPHSAGLIGPAALTEPRPGTVLCPVLSGTRCVLLELQALTATGFPGTVKRKASGLDSGRLAMIIAVLEAHAELNLADRDVFASSVGGVRVTEPASDLALLLAIAGAHLKRALPAATAAVGEVGLAGEIRPVPGVEQRIHEAVRLGCRRVLVPGDRGAGRTPRTTKGGAEMVLVRNVHQAIEALQ